MAIRLRKINGQYIALCAARSVAHKDDIYLDDACHGALSTKFALDFNQSFDCKLPFDTDAEKLIEIEESNNANRTEWDIWQASLGDTNT